MSPSAAMVLAATFPGEIRENTRRSIPRPSSGDSTTTAKTPESPRPSPWRTMTE